jgi:hypothetical protein
MHLVADAPQFLWLCHWKRLEHYLLNEREDRRSRSDP